VREPHEPAGLRRDRERITTGDRESLASDRRRTVVERGAAEMSRRVRGRALPGLALPGLALPSLAPAGPRAAGPRESVFALGLMMPIRGPDIARDRSRESRTVLSSEG
jgi:hypothetical protein